LFSQATRLSPAFNPRRRDVNLAEESASAAAAATTAPRLQRVDQHNGTTRLVPAGIATPAAAAAACDHSDNDDAQLHRDARRSVTV